VVDLGVALAWIAISAASAKGLAVFARAAVAKEVEQEAASGARGEGSELAGSRPDSHFGSYRIHHPSHPLGVHQ
jgi:hypothetical protein